jgi:predicted amidophosphoribosyltransferase
VCPLCGVQVTADQPSCTECGAVFEPKRVTPPKSPPSPAAAQISPLPGSPGAADRSGPRAAPPARRSPPPATSVYPMPPKRVETKFCIFCGARLAADDTFCWSCGNRLGGA